MGRLKYVWNLLEEKHTVRGDIPRRDPHAVGVRYMLYMHICREGLEGNTVTCLKLSWLLCFFLGGGYRAYFKPALYFFLYFLNIIKIYQS